MIKIIIHKNQEDKITGFSSLGHAEYDKRGKDIICSAVSVLIINIINSMEHLTTDEFDLKQNSKDGYIDFRLKDKPSDYASLLLDSMELGLRGIQNEYGNKYIKCKIKRD